MTTPILTKPGAYLDVSNEDYHRNPHLLPGPSLSSSGAKRLLNQSPLHFFYDSPMNPDRPAEPDKPHFNIGKAAHDLILLSDRWPEHYFVTPEGFSRAKSKVMAEAIAEADEAIDAGKTVLSHDQAEVVEAVANAIRKNELAMATLTNGVTEETIVWQDEQTGVWLRARPDFRPHSLTTGRKVRVVSDLKFVAPTHATPEGFAKSIANFGYALSAAWYWEGIKAVHGAEPTHWAHVVVEKEPPYCVAIYELPQEDIERGRVQMRRAINLFAECLKHDRWPGYADSPTPCGLPVWARMRLDEADERSFTERVLGEPTAAAA